MSSVCFTDKKNMEFMDTFDNALSIQDIASKLPCEVEEEWHTEADNIKVNERRRIKFHDLVDDKATEPMAAVTRLEEHWSQQFKSDFPEYEQDDKMEMSREDRQFLEIASDSATLVKGHYRIHLPLSNKDGKMPNNRKVVEQRALNLRRKLDKDPKYCEEYRAFLEGTIEKGYTVKLFHWLRRCDSGHYSYHCRQLELDIGLTSRGQFGFISDDKSELESEKAEKVQLFCCYVKIMSMSMQGKEKAMVRHELHRLRGSKRFWSLSLHVDVVADDDFIALIEPRTRCPGEPVYHCRILAFKAITSNLATYYTYTLVSIVKGLQHAGCNFPIMRCNVMSFRREFVEGDGDVVEIQNAHSPEPYSRDATSI
ncbi:hypothetical protein F2P81_023426 [Scophthalmus maximus]|uniref:Uncharacterized protein n=1 Tax=Scophthalmus maximus TaxID=52904 RepID=A0A6A4S265_SCOMX|nr:hypothetical protein F2P81_023426 [Scophthalmus maximus]